MSSLLVKGILGCLPSICSVFHIFICNAFICVSDFCYVVIHVYIIRNYKTHSNLVSVEGFWVKDWTIDIDNSLEICFFCNTGSIATHSYNCRYFFLSKTKLWLKEWFKIDASGIGYRSASFDEFYANMYNAIKALYMFA